MRKKLRAITYIVVCVALLCPLFLPATAGAAAAPKPFVLEQAQNTAVALDAAIRKKNSEITLKGIKYNEAVAGARAKAKNMSTFRWSPLLKFKFPEKLDLVMDYDLTATPLTLQIEITTLRHEKDDLVYEVKRRVAKLFTKVYIGQENISFTQKRLAAAETNLERNRTLLILGTAKQADVDRISKSVETLRADLALTMRTFETDKSELSDLIKLDVTTGYVFKNPLKTMNITRDQLAELVDYTLQNDHTYYAARMGESVARIALDSYERLFRGQYGYKVNAVSGFLNQARNGSDVDSAAFKMAYDNMTASFDSPWSGRIRILFFRFSKEWFKGQIDGTRYIEDEMYALYTAALEYLTARKDKEAAEKDLRKQIASEYEALITAKNAVDALLATVAETKTSLSRITELNRLGKAEFSEVADKQDDYQSLQAEAIETLAAYNDLLFDFDRLTCGRVEKLLQGAGIETDSGTGGTSRLDLPSYYIYSDVADMVFVFGLQIPEDYEPAIDAFELWYEGVQIGERTPVGKDLRHLTIDYGEEHLLTVRLYGSDEYVDECEVDTTIPSGVLKLRGGVPETQQERVVGQYALRSDAGAGTVTITLDMNAGSEAAFYRLTVNDAGLLTGERLPIATPFKYLKILSVDISELRAELFTDAGALLYTARFEPSTMSLCVPER